MYYPSIHMQVFQNNIQPIIKVMINKMIIKSLVLKIFH